ncbi:MAG: OpgC domain-containing protein, partial [Aliihoeflea sp.]
LGHQLGYNNILSMYAVVLLMLPLFLLIGTFSIGWMVAASGIMWLVAGLLPIAPPHFPNNGYWFLNPFSWQVLFVLGMGAMMHIKRGGSLPVNRWLVGAATAYLAIALLWVRLPLWGIDVSMGLPSIFTGFSKTFLSLPRMMHVVAIAYLLYALPSLSNIFRTATDNPLAVLGRHALPVFVVGTILSMAAQAWRGVFPPTIVSDVMIVATGIALQFALAYYIDWYRKLIRGSVKEPRRVVLHGRDLSAVPARPAKNQSR